MTWTLHRNMSEFGGPGEDSQGLAGSAAALGHHITCREANAQGILYFACCAESPNAAGSSNSLLPAALKSLRYGSHLRFRYKGREATGVYMDFGPNISTHRYLDLGYPLARALGFSGTGDVEWQLEGDVMNLTPNGAKLQHALDAQVGDPYIWGAEDCSELFYDVMGPEGFGVVKGRTTADDYYHMGARISKPERVGDYFVLLDSGTNHAHHIGMYYGTDSDGVAWTVEARGKAYGTPKYKLSALAARNPVWMRLKNVDLGPVRKAGAPAPPPPVYAYHTHARVMVADKLWNDTIGTQRKPAPGVGGIVAVDTGKTVTHAGLKYAFITWGGNHGGGWFRFDHLRWV